MLHIILHEPENPQNTGNVIRLCANTGAQLHLIHPLGFVWEDKRLRRAGLDYHEWAEVRHYDSLPICLKQAEFKHVYAFSTRGRAAYQDATYADGDALLFGSETAGLPFDVLDTLSADHILRIPMMSYSRCLNLANAVSVVIYEAWRQLGFPGGR